MSFGQILAKRVGYGLVLLIAVVVLNFTLITIAPGDVADAIAGDMGGADASVLAEIRQRYGLDQPFMSQLWRYLSSVAVMDLGYSYFYNTPVTELILQRLPATLLLIFSSQILAISVGVLLGVMAARKPNSLVNLCVTFLSLFGFAAPVFWTGILLIILFVSVYPVFPVGGMMNAALIDASFFEQSINIAYHLVLPMVTLASIYLALYSRLTRASMQEVLGSDYIRTARAKGLRENKVFYKHALKNSLGPLVTVAGLQFSAVMSGAVVVEAVFNWPGLGTLALQAILARDTPTIMGILFFSSLVVIVVNIITDLVLRMIDPRIRAE
ncbi:MAG: ABC transporter permease [Tateyamaria sp.]|jgi:peptide/nickel transport system permease protein|nr:ABC transporter permease [Tateyamaria sp.]MDG1182200.1 ABC transporter permease [Tateyamaria sp.]MDG1336883.1 ABC transporter permease [Tateyamaria sp.]MDG2057790.1 ABC transporter permease [Tateyamaria sp.]